MKGNGQFITASLLQSKYFPALETGIGANDKSAWYYPFSKLKKQLNRLY